MVRRVLGFLAIATALVLLLGLGGYKLMNSRTFQVTGELVARVETAEKVVALTFDDGPTPADTDRILAELAAEDVPATFFVIGENVEKDPDSVARIAAAGHELGNHSWSHPRMILMGSDQIAAEIEKTDAALQVHSDAGQGDAGQILFRPPFGKKLVGLPRYLAAHDRRTIMWDVAVEDYSSPDVPQSAEDLTRLTVDQVRPGSIILLHPWNGRLETQAAIGPVIRKLKSQGYRFVTVS
ncbi:MAG: polysaccharide deacetylase family protein, partial [Propionibacteriaceae bacterium]|nr:polysaccharide deacetylase family protein [Propionibacteriaceae bacterium]